MTPPKGGAATLARIRKVGIIPVIRADSATTAIRIAEALIEAGLGVIEITMTVPNALEALSTLARRFDSAVVFGAGSVTTPELAASARDAGSDFLATPCLLLPVIDFALAQEMPILAGALTPTEIFAAAGAGAEFVKVFPAHTAGGPAYLRALKGPFPSIELVPTGGVNLETAGAYIRAGAAAVGVGSELVPRDAVETGDFRAIGSLGRQFLEAIARARAGER